MKTAATENSTIEKRIQDLCEAIVADAEIQSAREQAEAFLADEEAVALYRDMASLGRSLHHKQHHGEEPTAIETSRYTDLQNRCDAHPLISAFMEAQDVLGEVAELVNRYVSRTLESGAVPSESDVRSGGCGEGCGCHH
ncbi:MAG: YlbF family regulator [Verrucomicrobiaceae bacterium]|nr:YlbF family regulator [Verrucomicrobiaceae bacterium]